MTEVAQNLAEVRRRLNDAAWRAGRDPARVRLVAVSKTVPAVRVREAVAACQQVVGENYVQEAQAKIAALGPGLSWHLVGHLQSNKAKAAAELFDLIHSVDRLSLAQAIDQAAARLGKVQEVLLQVNLAGEASKSGAAPEEAAALLKEMSTLTHLRVVGLMTMPPWLSDPEARTRRQRDAGAVMGAGCQRQGRGRGHVWIVRLHGARRLRERQERVGRDTDGTADRLGHGKGLD